MVYFSLMRLYEFEAVELFRREGIILPPYAIANSPVEAKEKAREVGLPVVLKAQVLTGGRYLAGGVQTADSTEEVEEITRRLLSTTIGGMAVPCVMIARRIAAERQFYLGITLNAYQGIPVAILSTEGGVSVNTVVREHPEWMASRNIPITSGLALYEAKQMAHEIGMSGRDVVNIAEELVKLYRVFCSNDAIVAEINPLVRTPEGEYLALDAKVEIDDSGLYRHPELNVDMTKHFFNHLEQKGREIGVTYVELDGDIALIASGAGLGLASIDIIGQKLRPANFLETGGGISEELLYKVMGLVLQKKGIRAIFINVYGGINPIHEGAKGIVRYMQEHNITIPVVAKALGNRQEETWEILRRQGVVVVTDVSTEKAVDALASILEGEK
jgi:succinyl-CoA synthetase beta subunit